MESLLPLEQYDLAIVSFSGGKDSLACTLDLLDRGFPAQKIELWHQHVDGEPGTNGLMDWPCTESYVRACGKALNLPVRFQWKDGGFEGEMMRENAPTKGVFFEDGDGKVQYLPPSTKSKNTTRLLFPQQSADLSVRWCSAYVKIDVARRAINNDPRFKNAKILFITGERRQESSARAKYNEVEPGKGSNKNRRVDQWRSIIDREENQVWDIIRKYRINPHPAYFLGFGRVSCMTCIFADKDQWATIRQIAPNRIDAIAQRENKFGKTIKKGLDVIQQANQGTPFIPPDQQHIVKLALSKEYPAGQIIVPEHQEWKLPAGAFRRCGGPS